MAFERFVGIDVAKDKVDIYDSQGMAYVTLPNTSDSIGKFFKSIDPQNTLCIIENTGGYERVCIEELLKAGMAIHRTDNVKVKGFIRSLGLKAKTDAIDCKALSQYGQERWKDLKLFSKTEDSEINEKIRQLSVLLKDLKAEKIALINKIKSAGCWEVEDFLLKKLEETTELIEEIEQKINEVINGNKKKKEKFDKLVEYKGVSDTTAMALLAFLPELGKVGKGEIAALAGLAPYAKDSGKIKGRRTTGGNGRPRAKEALYMACMSAIRFNKSIAEFYQRLRGAGKKPLVAITACMRKMLVQLNAISRQVEQSYTTQETKKGGHNIC